MATRKPPSQAMAAFCAQVNELGASEAPSWKAVTPRRVEAWLQEGLLPSPARPSRGRGGGRTVSYSDEHVARAVEIAHLVRRWRSLDIAALVLFDRGRDVPERRLKAGLLALLGRVRREIDEAATAGRDAIDFTGEPSLQDRVEFAEPVVADRIRRDKRGQLLREGIASQPALNLDALAFGLVGTLIGLPDAQEQLAEILREALGLTTGPDPASEHLLSATGLSQLHALVEGSSIDDPKRARRISGTLERLRTTLPGSRDAEPLIAAAQIADDLGHERSRALHRVLLPLVLAVQLKTDLARLEEQLLRATSVRHDIESG